MTTQILNPTQILNLNPYGYLLDQYYTNMVNRNLMRHIINGGDNNLENINVVLNIMNQVVENLHDTLNNQEIGNNMTDDQRLQLNLINNLRDM